MIRPNFVIIGAPKCGTSSLFNWLARHPDIAASTVKEPFFLMDEGHPLAREPNVHIDGMEAYSRYFPNGAADARIRMEATTHYLYQQTSLDILSRFDDVKVAVVLREPASRVFSSFSFTRNNLARLAPQLDFSCYLELLERNEPLYSRWCRHEGSAYVLEGDPAYSRYAVYLHNWVERMGCGRIFPILFEQMRENPRIVTQELCHWLGIDAVKLEDADLQGSNLTHAMRWHRLHGMAREANRWLRLPTSLKKAVKPIYHMLQGSSAPAKSDPDREAVARLRNSYRDDNARLADLMDLDLSVWGSEP